MSEGISWRVHPCCAQTWSECQCVRMLANGRIICCTGPVRDLTSHWAHLWNKHVWKWSYCWHLCLVGNTFPSRPCWKGCHKTPLYMCLQTLFQWYPIYIICILCGHIWHPDTHRAHTVSHRALTLHIYAWAWTTAQVELQEETCWPGPKRIAWDQCLVFV